MNDSAEQIEKEFNDMFNKIGYERVDSYFDKTPDFANADYINKKKNIVVELKVLDKDFFKNGGVIDAVNGFVPIPKDINPDGTGMYEFTLPEKNRNGRHDTMEEPLRRIIKKANKQLKETKAKFLSNNGSGFLILAVNMKTSIDPRLIQIMTIRILSKEFNTINGVIFCTPKGGLQLENGLFQPVCLHCQDARLSSEHQKELMNLVDAWCAFVDSGGHN